MINYLIFDNGKIKTFDVQNSIFLEIEGDLSEGVFISHGMNLKTLNLALSERIQLIDNKPKVLALSAKKQTITLNEKCLAYGEFVELTTDVDFSNSVVNNIQSINIKVDKSPKDIIKIILSLDKGRTWITHYNNAWIKLDNHLIDILDFGMEVEYLNGLPESELIEISGTKKIRILWHMKKNSLDSLLNVSLIDIKYNTNV
ncbi:MAG: hypothetical protein ACRCWG_10595 [Sarcina sp.]